MKKKIPVKRRLTGWLKALPFTFVELILCVFLAFPFLFVLSTSRASRIISVIPSRCFQASRLKITKCPSKWASHTIF